MDVGLMLVAVTRDLQHWHAWRAKNTACKIAAALAEHEGKLSDTVAVVLDGDNVLGARFPGHVRSIFDAQPPPKRELFVHWRGTHSGTCGRKGCWLESLKTVGGFREDLYPVGYGDVDLRNRFGVWARAAGLTNREALI
ncbi:MAG: hypothetical protein GY772_02000 [bacterium]|nr:hypothetical protein [bacterium]